MPSTQLIQFAGEVFSVIIMPDGRKAMTAETIGAKLGYAEPRKRINRLFNEHRNEFKDIEDIGVLKLRTPGGAQDAIVFYNTGAIKVCMFARTTEAERYRDIFAKVLAGLAQAEEQSSAKSRRPYMTESRRQKLSDEYFKFIEEIEDEPVAAERQAKDALQTENIRLRDEQIAILKEHVAMQKQLLALVQSNQSK